MSKSVSLYLRNIQHEYDTEKKLSLITDFVRSQYDSDKLLNQLDKNTLYEWALKYPADAITEAAEYLDDDILCHCAELYPTKAICSRGFLLQIKNKSLFEKLLEKCDSLLALAYWGNYMLSNRLDLFEMHAKNSPIFAKERFGIINGSVGIKS